MSGPRVHDHSIRLGGVIDAHPGRDALEWPRFNGSDHESACYLASLVRTEIGLGNWSAGDPVPDRTQLAEAIGATVSVADTAIAQLVSGGWIAPYPDGGYRSCEPPPRLIRAGGFHEAVHGRALPGAIEFVEPSPGPTVVAPSLAPAHPERALEVPRQKVRDRKLETHSTYLVGIEGLPLVKIGRTTADPKTRLKGLQTGQPMQLFLLWSCEGDYEADLHVHFDAYHHRGEWFDLTPLGDPIEVVKAAVEEIKAASSD